MSSYENVSLDPSRRYAIEQRQLSILDYLGLTQSHNYWALLDVTDSPSGVVIKEFHGRPYEMDGGTEIVQTIGLPGHNIGFYQYSRDVMSGDKTTIYRMTSDANDLASRWNEALKIFESLKSKSLMYDPLPELEPDNYVNSNTVAYTFGRALGFFPGELNKMQYDSDPNHFALPAPGYGRDLALQFGLSNSYMNEYTQALKGYIQTSLATGLSYTPSSNSLSGETTLMRSDGNYDTLLSNGNAVNYAPINNTSNQYLSQILYSGDVLIYTPIGLSSEPTKSYFPGGGYLKEYSNGSNEFRADSSSPVISWSPSIEDSSVGVQTFRWNDGSRSEVNYVTNVVTHYSWSGASSTDTVSATQFNPNTYMNTQITSFWEEPDYSTAISGSSSYSFLMGSSWGDDLLEEEAVEYSSASFSSPVHVAQVTSSTSRFEESRICFAAGTPIRMGDGTLQPIEAIKAGDRVMAFDGAGPLTPRRVVAIKQTAAQEVVAFAGVRCTASHRFLTGDGTFKAVRELQPGEELMRENGSLLPFPGAAPVTERETVYNFEVEELHINLAIK